MGISFSCESCKKKVKAPDGVGGKWGNCPHCKHRCYIPLPASAFENEDELKLAPMEESDETQYDAMMRETHDLTQNILHETAAEDDAADAGRGGSERELVKHIIIYLHLMAAGKLEQAAKVENKIAPAETAKDILKRMAKTERPEPELQDVEPKVLQSLIKRLYAKL